METFLLVFALFGMAMLGLSIGVIFSGKELSGSCGGVAVIDGAEPTCGACGKKEADVCPTDHELVRIAQLGHPNPAHHR